MKSGFNTELLPPPTLVTIFFHSVNVATNAIKGDELSGWDYRSINSTILATDRSIMAMSVSGKTAALTKDILARFWGCRL